GRACAAGYRVAPAPLLCQSEHDGPDDFATVFDGFARTGIGTHCFRVSGKGTWFINGTSLALTSSAGVQCIEATSPLVRLTGVRISDRAHPITSIVERCLSGSGADCNPVDIKDVPLFPPCEEGECGKEQCPCEKADECDSDGDCAGEMVCGEDNGSELGKQPGNYCWDAVC